MIEPGWASWSLNPQRQEWELKSVTAASPISLLRWNDSDKMSYYYYYVPLCAVFRLQGYILQLWLIIFVCYLYHALSCCSYGFVGNPDHPSPHTVCTAKWLLYSTMHKLSIISDKTPSQYTSMPQWCLQQFATGPHPQPDESRPNFSVYFFFYFPPPPLFNIIISYLSHTCHYVSTILMSFPVLP